MRSPGPQRGVIMQYGLIGARLGHSYSASIHRQLGDYDYRLYECTESECIDLLKRREFKGLNVTIPYKKLAYGMCDSLSDAAREVGCVNTLVVRADGSLYGHNTDLSGFIALAGRAGVTIAGKKAVILGSGGTSLTVRAACIRLGARETVVVSRRSPVDYAALYRSHADAEVLINTTPVGMYPESGACPADIAALSNLEGVLDVIYNPDRTRLMLDAEARNIPCAGGLYMLVDQAREAAELFTGGSIPQSETGRIHRMLRRNALNVILIGMPGCGKSAVGRALAARMGRAFVDCDQEIVRRAGKPIPEIFSRDGESAFREMEASVVADFCRRNGLVIATGGGAVLRKESVRAMRQNGRVILLERAMDALDMTGRPLSPNRRALEALWGAREPLYRAAADIAVDNNAAPEQAAARAEEAFYEAVDR